MMQIQRPRARYKGLKTKIQGIHDARRAEKSKQTLKHAEHHIARRWNPRNQKTRKKINEKIGSKFMKEVIQAMLKYERNKREVFLKEQHLAT